ncbi:MAG: hypothetical protein IJN63_01550, partial [Clostridia bacterium]|nr:hypothetical protein [Clostridia bacterium]
MKRAVSFVIFAAMLAVSLCACGETVVENATPVVTTVPTVDTTVATTEYVELPDLPEGYFANGYNFTILCTSWMNNPPTPFKYKDTALVLDEAIYRRNTTVEDAYGIVIETVEDYTTAGNSGVMRLQANRTSGDTLYD